MTGDKVTKENMAYPDMSDLEMALKVRMLYRDDLEFESVLVGARDRIMYLSQQVDACKELIKTLDSMFHDNIVAMQASWIEWQHGEGADAGMQWIENTLEGPGHIPDSDQQFWDMPQAWHDKYRSNPFPTCWCGMPSNILSKGKGFCCEQHRSQKESIFTVPSKRFEGEGAA